MNLRLMLEASAKQYGTKTAVVMGERRLSYIQLDEMANKVANALLGMGVKKGDRVAMLLTNSPEFVAFYFGVVKIGGIAVPLDTRYKLGELTSLFDNSKPKVVVSESPILEPIVKASSRFGYIKHIIDVRGKEIMSAPSALRSEVALKPQDIAHIAYTSGPTLRPRGVVLSHESLVREAAISAAGFRQTDRDVVALFALPMHHAFGLVVVMMTAIFKGSTVVMVPGLSIDNLLEVIEREKVTIFMGVPFIYLLLVDKVEAEGMKHDLSSLRLCGSAGAAMPGGVLRRFQQLFKRDAVDFWGMTESSAHVTCQSLDGVGKPGSVGKALAGWELKIVDGNGRELPPNQPGEIIVRGPVMKGYYKSPEATARAIRNGWLYTGDVGRLDEASNLFLTGMSKDMIIVKGQNIYPGDIEAVLSTHPKVAEVAVVGIPDEIRGETVRVVVRLKPGSVADEAELKHFCREHMADFKVPRQIVFVNSLPKTADGKVDKKSLRRAG